MYKRNSQHKNESAMDVYEKLPERQQQQKIY